MTIRILLVGLLLLGAGIWVYASLMPAFVAGPIKSESDLRQALSNEPRATYYQKEAQLRTNRNELLDVGSGVTVASATILLFAVRRRLQTGAQLWQLRTVNKLQFFIWFNAGWIVLFASLQWYYMYRGGRGDYPPFADSIGIPLMYGEAALLTCWPVLNLLLLLAIWPARLPGRLFEIPHTYTWRAVLVEGLCGVWLVMVGLYSLVVIADGDHLTIPVLLLFLYLLLVLRAGHMQAINQQRQ